MRLFEQQNTRKVLLRDFSLILSIGLACAFSASAADDFFDGTDMKTDALMRAAEKSIEEHRKGLLTVELVGPKGKPVTAPVQAELVDHEFAFGANLFGFHRLGHDDPAKETALKVIDELFNTVVVCDYWGANQKRYKGKCDWTSPDAGYAIADKLGKQTRYHALLFGFPRWLDRYKTKEEHWTAIEHRLKQVADRYGDRIREVDVINEFVNYQYWNHSEPAQLLKRVGYPNMAKPENAVRVLKLARKYFPNAKLVVLEASLWNVSNPVFQEIYEYHKELIRLGAPFDYIGYQAHYYSLGGMPFQEGHPKFGSRTFMMDEIDKGIELMGLLGKPMVITEFNPPSRSNKVKNLNQPRISDEEVAAWETNFYTLMFSKPYMKGVSRWFTIDNLGGRGMDAGIVTEEGALKPNYYALEKLIKVKWHTDWKGRALGGAAKFKGFYGTYRVKVDGFKAVTVDLTAKNPSRRIELISQ